MDGMRKKLKKSYGFGLALLFLCMAGAAGLQAAAEEDAVVGILYEVTTDTEVKESASADSATVGRLQAGTTVIVESRDDTWSRVLYRELTGYVASDALEVYAEEQMENLAQEMNSVAEEEQRSVEEAELAAKQRRVSLLWGAVLAILILAIFGLGVASAVKSVKEEEQKEDSADSDRKTKELEIENLDEEQPF